MLEIDLEEEKKEIIKRYRNLLRKCQPFLKKGDNKLIRKAFKMAADAHKEMRRKSGEPYIYHPLAVAQICVEEIGLFTTSVICSLLHDVVEDTDVELRDIEREFGPKVAEIIDGLTKIPGVFDQNVSLQAENFRKMLLTLSSDIRVILIKLADRLHNMRTLDSVPRESQLKISSETVYIYAPLAHRLGLYNIKMEMEDLSMKHTDPEIYREIVRKLQETKEARNKFIRDFIKPVKEELVLHNFNFEILGRPKSISSIWNKMKKQQIPFEEVYDLFAIRIILSPEKEDEKTVCWRAYSVVTNSYQPNPERLRDWISTPKANGYESLHTTVMSNTGKWVEVQVRTERMNEIAEKGLAAHWKYKNLDGDAAESSLDLWLNKIKELLSNPSPNTMDFIDDFRMNLFSDEVYVFTPKGDLKTLPHDSTALDFAFDIHSQVGLKCIGAKVNQKIVPLSYTLKNGDQAEILTSNKQKPSEDWMKYVVTAKAKSKIKEALREQKKKIAKDGEEKLKRKLNRLKIEFNQINTNKLLAYYKVTSALDLFYAIAENRIDIKDLKTVFQENKTKLLPSPEKTFKQQLKELRGIDEDSLLIGEDLDKVDYTLSKCCNPIHGDDVFGFVTINEGIKIHRSNCPNAISLMSNYGYRIIKAKWMSQQEVAFLTGLSIIGLDSVGILNKITKVISDELKVNIRSITVDSDDGMFNGKIMLFVNDTKHLEILIQKLLKVNGVLTVTRLQ